MTYNKKETSPLCSASFSTAYISSGKSRVFAAFRSDRDTNRDQNLASAPLSRSRAELCEILAIRTLRAHVSASPPSLTERSNDVIFRALAIIFSR